MAIVLLEEESLRSPWLEVDTVGRSAAGKPTPADTVSKATNGRSAATAFSNPLSQGLGHGAHLNLNDA